MTEYFSIPMFLISAICFFISIRHFSQKGFLFNNAWLYASESERKEIDKKPHYIQSGVCFVLIGIIFVLDGIEFILMTGFLSKISIAAAIIAVIFAIVSTVIIEKRK